MKKITALVLLVSVLSGCGGSIGVKNFGKGYENPVQGSKVDVFLVGTGVDDIGSIRKIDATVASIADQMCSPSAVQKTDAGLIPIIAGLGKYMFDRYQDKKADKLKAMKKAATSSYSDKIILPAGALKQAVCGVVVRHDGQGESGLVAVLSFQHYSGEGFTVTPIYIQANNAAVLRAKATNKINVALGVSVNAIGKGGTKLPVKSEVGSAAVSVANVEIGSNANLCEDRKCGYSDLVPHISDNNKVVSIGLSVTEVGHVGIDFDQRLAEIEAIKEAFGPAIKEGIAAELADD